MENTQLSSASGILRIYRHISERGALLRQANEVGLLDDLARLFASKTIPEIKCACTMMCGFEHAEHLLDRAYPTTPAGSHIEEMILEKQHALREMKKASKSLGVAVNIPALKSAAVKAVAGIGV